MDSDNDSYHSESEFYYLDEETPKRQTHAHGVKLLQEKINTNISYKVISQRKKLNTLFAGLGRSVLRKTVPSVLSTALGLRPRAVLKTSGTLFPNTDLPAGK